MELRHTHVSNAAQSTRIYIIHYTLRPNKLRFKHSAHHYDTCRLTSIRSWRVATSYPQYVNVLEDDYLLSTWISRK